MPRIYKVTDPSVIGKNHCLTVYEPDRLIFPNPIIALHGMWATSRRWENYGKFFSDRGFRFLAPDLRHHHPDNNLTELGTVGIMDYRADISVLIWNLLILGLPDTGALQEPIIFGHSMGGLIAQKLPETAPMSRLVLMNSAPPAGIKLHADLRYQLAILRYLPKILGRKPFKLSFKTYARFIMNNMPESQWPELYQGAVHESGQAALDIRFGKIPVNFSKINMPALIIGCEKDRITPPAVAQGIGSKMEHEDWTHWCYPQFAHWMQVEPGWELAANNIFKWLTAEK